MRVDAMLEAKAHKAKLHHFCGQGKKKSLQLLIVPQENGIS